MADSLVGTQRLSSAPAIMVQMGNTAPGRQSTRGAATTATPCTPPV
jgi:hypothetical protein